MLALAGKFWKSSCNSGDNLILYFTNPRIWANVQIVHTLELGVVFKLLSRVIIEALNANFYDCVVHLVE